eukprot:TRINITY_DN2148_c0_g1_i4.p1 TRINITY_DN2148_c0_g1~~TRINITY_DN2148_c0_g1_i4.p1  ORF type:complete len:389 (+),score=51.96 TRINITY_DN2148_c0_g1_i4:185-1351(+)
MEGGAVLLEGEEWFQNLPVELHCCILVFLPPRDRSACHRVCRLWHAILDEDRFIWENTFNDFIGTDCAVPPPSIPTLSQVEKMREAEEQEIMEAVRKAVEEGRSQQEIEEQVIEKVQETRAQEALRRVREAKHNRSGRIANRNWRADTEQFWAQTKEVVSDCEELAATPEKQYKNTCYLRLIWAASRGYDGLLKRIIEEAGSDIIDYEEGIIPSPSPAWFTDDLYESIKTYHDSVLHVAAARGFLRCVQILLDNGAAVDHDSVDHETPLYFASRFGHIDVMKALLAAKANPNAPNSSGGTALHRAAREGQVEAMKLLLANKADIAAHDMFHQNIYHFACRHSQLEVIRWLLENYPDAGASSYDAYGFKPYTLAKGQARAIFNEFGISQ